MQLVTSRFGDACAGPSLNEVIQMCMELVKTESRSGRTISASVCRSWKEQMLEELSSNLI